MNSVHCHGAFLRSNSSLRSVHLPFTKAISRPVRSVGRKVGRQTRRMAIFNGDVVADDKINSEEKTAAASSRGLAGLPEKPEDMRQSTPAASKFMQVLMRVDTFFGLWYSVVHANNCPCTCRTKSTFASVTFNTAGEIRSTVTTLMITYILRTPFPSSQTTQVGGVQACACAIIKICAAI